MLKKPVIIGIILLFILLTVHPMAIGYNTKNFDTSIQTYVDYNIKQINQKPNLDTYINGVFKLSNPSNNEEVIPYIDSYIDLFDKDLTTSEIRHMGSNASDVFFTTPLNNSIYRAGDTIPIKGNITGKGFKRYIIEHGQGLNATFWYSTGINLEFNGCQPVVNGTIATWDTSNILESDFYTLRIKVRYWKSEIFSILNPLLRFSLFNRIFDDMFSIFDTEETFYIKNMYFDTSLKQGWPVKIKFDLDDIGSGQGYYWWPGRVMPVVSDVDNDGVKEIFVIQQADWSIVHGFEPDGSYVEGWPQEITYDIDPGDGPFPTLMVMILRN